MKKLSIILVALFMLMGASCKSNNPVEPATDTIAYNFWQSTDLWEDEELGAWYVEYRLNPERDSKDFIYVYIYDEELLDRLINQFWMEGDDVDYINSHYAIECCEEEYRFVEL